MRKINKIGKRIKRKYTRKKKRSEKGRNVTPARKTQLRTEDVFSEDEQSSSDIIIKTEPSPAITPNDDNFNIDVEKFKLLEQIPIVYTTRIDDMDIINRLETRMSKFFENVEYESRPKFTPDSLKRKARYVYRPFTYLQLKSMIQKANVSIIQSLARRKRRLEQGLKKRLKEGQQKKCDSNEEFIDKAKNASLNTSPSKDPKNITFHMYQLLDNYFVLRNTKTKEADVYYFDHKGTIIQHYITNQSVEDLHMLTQKHAEVSYCCWHKREEYLTLMSGFLTAAEFTKLSKPHSCRTECTCCCKKISCRNIPNAEPHREPCNKINATITATTNGSMDEQKAEIKFVPSKLDLLIQRMIHNKVRTSPLLLKAFNFYFQKQIKVTHIFFTHKYGGNEYYEIGDDGEIRQYLKNVTSFYKQECIARDQNWIDGNICCWYQREKYVQSLQTSYRIRKPKNMATRHSCPKAKCICCCNPLKKCTSPPPLQQVSSLSSKNTHVFFTYKDGGNDYYEIGPQAEIRQHWKNVSGFFKQECLDSDQNSINIKICCWYQHQNFVKSLETKYKLHNPKKFTVPHNCQLSNCICCCKPSENSKKKVHLEEIILPDIPNYSYKPCKKIAPLKFVFTTHDPSITENKVPKAKTNVPPKIEVENNDSSSLNVPENILDGDRSENEFDAATKQNDKYRVVFENAKYKLENRISSLKNTEVSLNNKGLVIASLNVPVTKLGVNELNIVVDVLTAAQKDVDTLKKNNIVMDPDKKILNESKDTGLSVSYRIPQTKMIEPKKPSLIKSFLYKSLSDCSKTQDSSYLYAMKLFITLKENAKKKSGNFETDVGYGSKPKKQASEGRSKRKPCNKKKLGETSNEASSKPKRRKELMNKEIAQTNDQNQDTEQSITKENIDNDPVATIDDTSDDSVQFIDNDSAVCPVTTIAENTIDQEHL